METKLCRKCGEEKLTTAEFFYFDKRYPDKPQLPCKTCRQADGREYSKTHRETRNRNLQAWRNRNPGLESQRRSPEQKAKDAARVSAWAKSHPDRILERQREKRRDNPEYKLRLIENHGRRRVRKFNGKSERIRWKWILETYGKVCHLCGDEMEGEMHWDHVIPLSRGGDHVTENIRPAHPSCNLQKYNRLPDEYEMSLGLTPAQNPL